MSAPARKSSARPTMRRQSLYEPLDWLLVRAPLLPVETYLALSRPEKDGQPANGSVAGPELYRTMLADPCIRAALAVGGGNLYNALSRADRRADIDPESAGKLLRYLIRMSTRPTPYGLFAGVALARWDRQTDLALASGRPRTRTRPDMAWLLRLVLEAESRQEVRRQLGYIANTRAFRAAGRVFLPEAAPTADTGGPGPAVSARASTVVYRALSLARTPIAHRHLVADLAKMPGATIDKVERLIEGLWQQTLLLTELRPPLTEPSPAAYVAQRLRKLPAASDLCERLDKALAAMAEWDALPIENAAGAYRQLATHFGDGQSTPSQGSPQVDMALTLGGSRVAHLVAGEAVRAAELLLRLTPLPSGLPSLDAYRRAFETRYGPEREVPLLELLDPNFGLGPPSPFHGATAGGDPRKMALRHQSLHQLALTALRERQLVIDLDEDLLGRLESCAPSARMSPRSLDLALFVVARSAADVDNGRFQIVVGPNLGASAAGRNLGRFADLLGEEAVAALQLAERAEAASGPDCLRAELVYLPRRFRSANVAIRPNPRPFEIVLGTTPGNVPDHVVPLDELIVGIRDGRFYVRWSARDKEILVCAGHMLNNLQAPDVCRFLDDVQRDGRAQFSSFDWGPAAGFPVLPRVQAGRIVLCPAQWRIDARLGAELAADSPAGFAGALRRWRERWQVPRYVYLAYGDNRLLLDLDDEAQIEELRAELRRLTESAQILLQEALPAPDGAWVGGPGGRFIAELIVPMVLQSERNSGAAAAPPVAAVASGDRLRPPGTDWLFAKLYCPRAFEDDLLTGPVAEFCQQALAGGLADDWFFIRYADPDPHLRLRFRGDPGRLTRRLLPHLCAWVNGLLSEGLCTRLSFDTYEREVERFGGSEGIIAAEAVFGADSRAVLEMLRLSQRNLLELDMTSLAVVSIDDLLAALGLSEAERLVWYRERVASRSTASDDYRRRQQSLRRLLGDAEAVRSESGGDALMRILARRAEALAEPGGRLDTLAAAKRLSQPKHALLRSYVHLHCNRLLAGDRAGEEQVLALLARARYGLAQYKV